MNFTSEVFTGFAPYRPENPIDAELMVGGQKQAELQQGIQKVQGFVDSLHGFDIAKDVTRDYIQGKIGDLKQSISNVSGDFSDQRLVNQIGGMAGKIASDPVVQNGIVSTSLYRKGIQDIEDSKKSKTYGVSNEAKFLDSASKWLNDKDYTTPFEGRYTPKYDIDKDIREGVKDAHVSEIEWQEFPKNSDGTVNTDALVQKMKKGLLSSRVQGIVSEVFAKPEVQQQLATDGWYTYRNYTPDMLKKEADESVTFLLNKYRDQMNELNLKNTLSKDDREKANQSLIDLTNQIANTKEQYLNSIKLLQHDPEAFKEQYYTQNQMQRYINDYSWEENSEKLVPNPIAEMSLKRQEFDFKKQEFAFNMMDKNREYELKALDEERKRAIAEGKLNPDGSNRAIYQVGAINPSDIQTGMKMYKDETSSIEDRKNQLQASIFQSLNTPEGSPVKYSDMFVLDENGRWQINYEKYKDWNTIAPYYKAALKEIENQHQNGTVANDYKSDVQQLYDLNSLLLHRGNLQNKIEGDFQNRMSALLGQGKNLDVPVIPGNPATSRDILDMWVVDHKSPGWEQSETRLKSKYKDVDAFRKTIKTQAVPAYRSFGLTGPNPFSVEGGIVNALYNKVGELLSPIQQRMEQDYTKLQKQQNYEIGQFQPKDENDLKNINRIYLDALTNLTGDKKGDYKNLYQWMDAVKSENLNDNLYQFYKDNGGNWFLRIKRGTGTSDPIPVSEEFIKQHPAVTTNPQKDAFNDTFWPFLKLHNGNSTVGDLSSPEAENTAIVRREVGKYSVGFQLQKLHDEYRPYIYVRDKATGKVLANGLLLDASKLSKDPTIPEEKRDILAGRGAAIAPETVLDALNSVDEHLIDVLLKNK